MLGPWAHSSQNQNQGQRPNGRPARNITGPQSALTDFLAAAQSHNISARQIRDDADQRRQQAAAAARLNSQESSTPAPVASSSGTRTRSARRDTGEEIGSNKAEEKNAIEKVKTTKAFKKRKKRILDSDDDEEVARAIFETKHAPLPGQMENCAICGKRFTVTPYSLAAPGGGLLCAPCGKELAKERQGQPKKKPRKQVGGVGSRRAMQSRILDGDVGTKSLATLCVQTLAKNVDMADSLGDLPDHLVDKIARLFSKGRLLKPETLPLFAQPTTETLHIYDGAKLGEQDFISAFQVAPNLRRFKARCAIQFKDGVMDYVLSRDTSLESFYLHGANLLSERKWHEFLAQKGRGLKGLQVYYTDCHFGDESIVKLAEHCPDLLRLKVENNQKLTDKGVEAIGELPSLEHVGLQLQNRSSSSAIVGFVSKIGEKLKTLSLKIMPEADDSVLKCIHNNCRSLNKLRITDSERMTDQAFAELFTGWANAPLQFVDLQKCRHIDSTRPRDNDDGVGLCSEGFKALMAHSGPKLETLNVHACRHISREAFEEAFNDKAHYPELRELEISFCEEVTDFVLGCIFRACPKIKEVNVFGCMKVKDVRVPRGVILVGVPNAQGMITEGVD
ncbi:DNA repair protein Rad7 [Hirsutella rhossiliensis]|uniref:DNA repair protein Rad7 n=1 Tax=Hirsutella rhossiliensis TaxID=111463 RepID=A0A9P8N3Y1_9HYPO|nr:DNA repair protein Rad7 [Hirsutella rhossiliensis]KAH0967928.1 DNA repair protein Rad7 [Hirsutella rhossiliensis]